MTDIRSWLNFRLPRRSREGKGRFYRYSLILALCMSSIPTAVIGFSSYVLGTEHIEREVMSSHRALVKRSAESMDELFEQVEQSAARWALDPRLDADLRRANLRMEYQRTQELYRFLGLMKASYPELKDAKLLLAHNEPLLLSDTEGLRKVSFLEDSKRFQSIVDAPSALYWLEDFRWTASENGEVVLVRKLPGYGDPYGALLLNMDRKQIEERMRRALFDDKGASFLFASSGPPLIRMSDVPSDDPMRTLTFESALREELRTQVSETPDSYLFKWQGKTYSVSHSQLQRPGVDWTYVTVSPLEALTRPVVLLSRSLLAVSLAGMLLALLLAWLASHRLHRPIGRLVHILGSQFSPALGQPSADRAAGTAETSGGEKGLSGLLRRIRISQRSKSGPDGTGIENAMHPYDELHYIEASWRGLSDAKREAEARLEHTYPELRSAFLMQLMQGHYQTWSERELLSRMERFGWSIHPDERMLVFLLQVGVLSPPESKFREEDELLMTFAAANVAHEFVEQHTERAIVVNFQDSTAAVLIPYSIDENGCTAETDLEKALAGELAGTIRSVLRLQTLVCIGSASGILEVPELLHSLRAALRHIQQDEDCRVLHLDEWRPDLDQQSTYPFELERELLRSVKLGQIEEAAQLTDEFMDELARRAASKPEMRNLTLHLLGSLLHTMMRNGAQPEHIDCMGLYERLATIRQPKAMAAFVREQVLEPYGREIGSAERQYTDRLAERVKEEIERDYTADFSLESCAERFGLSPYTLSRSFKLAYGKNFVDYVMELRLERGRELLCTTDLKVNEIAESVGYHPSYFIRLFRKQEGMTPGQYRMKKNG
ncbi:AraC family transcriptional regulator [Paenibacillus tarimensis]|uniref:AraC family transcriptional regulator n=1 Tax=Paenibacillus tarimensis TaxID=416012 RepID=UPI001F2CD9C3|nr:AraC family transcriptional regulator [Paenibacillus tarimensis]MCF2942768.1 AraC family transcriptional regulator [Paenibacillus tarimensis]